MASLFLFYKVTPPEPGPQALRPCAVGNSSTFPGDGKQGWDLDLGMYLKVVNGGDSSVGGSPLVPLPQRVPGFGAEQSRSLFFLEILYQR